MRISLKTLAIATSTVACAAMLSIGWAEQAQAATRLYVSPTYYYNRARIGLGLPWYAVRAYYDGGPWCSVGGYGGYGGYGLAGGAWGGSWTCYSGWPDYKARNGIVCDPGTVIKGGDGISYMCQ
jgi:hypothetical protein